MSSFDCDLGLVKITEFVDHRFNRFVCSNAKTTMVAPQNQSFRSFFKM